MAKDQKTAPPAGTGNAPGLGEAFSINLSSGQGTYVYRMPLPDGVARHSPKLTLEYTHGAGLGPWGLGWRSSLRSIARRLDFGTPDEGLVERFLDSGSEIVRLADGTYGAVRESMFSRYHRQDAGWRIEERTGVVHTLGVSAAARVADPDHPDRIIEWLLESTADASGNTINYTYRIDEGMAYPAAIRYAIYEVRFHYENRPDARRDGRAGFLRRRNLRCSRIQLVLDPGPHERVIRSWTFGYALSGASGVSLLANITLVSHGPAADGSQDVLRPPVTFEYSDFDIRRYRIEWMESDGAPPPGLTEPDVALLTLDDAPLPGILINRNGREYYWANRGNGAWAAPRPLPAAPLASSFKRAGIAFVDMDGSGDADMMVANEDSLQGYYENDGREGWGRFIAFPRSRRTTPAWRDPNLRLIDADGDGIVDAVVSQRRALVWWRNGGRLGWDQPLLIPKSDPDLLAIDFRDPDVHLADMSGDGMSDVVGVRSGRIEYWPSLGRGCFGQRVLMQNAPRIRRQPNDSLLFADLDGDGCADLVHVSSRGIQIYQNQNGERFADPVLIENIPPPIRGSIQAINLEGRAGAGLLWNSDTRRGVGYVRFSPAETPPPYVLSAVENGSGLKAELSYRSAVEDYVRDREEGRIWTTHFPFPYLVVGRTKETDAVSGRTVETIVKYHEAHFEGRTRQFQGFRTTERIEVGDESRPSSLQIHHFHMAEEQVPGHGPEHAALNGLLHRVEYFQLDGTENESRSCRIETSEHGLKRLDDTPAGEAVRSFVFVTTYRVEDSERTDDVRVEEKTYSYDELGNVVRERLRGSGVKGGAVQPVRERVTEIEYAASATRYLLGKIGRTVLRDGAGQLQAEKRFFYDGPAFTGLPFGDVDRGLISRAEDWVLTQADFDAHYAGLSQPALGYVSGVNADGVPSVFTIRERTAHDSRGLPTATRDAVGSETRVGYDNDGLFRVRLEDPIGESHFQYDRATGQINRISYPDGAVTQFEYDAQGRLLRAAFPGEALADSPTSHTYDESSVPNRKTVRFRQPNGQTSISVTFYDGYGAAFQERVEVEPGRFVVSGVQKLNPWGDLKEEFEPFFDSTADFGAPPAVGASRKLFYDARGRAVRCINYNSGESTVRIEPFRITTWDANDNDASAENVARGQFDTPHVEEFDVFRNLQSVTERLGGARTVITTFETGPMNELLAVFDSQGQKFRYRYDRLGNRIELMLRDAGNRKLWYDAARRLIRSLDGEGRDLRAVWDPVGRLQRLSSGHETLEEYTYDTAIQNAFGRLAAVVYPGGQQVFDYDQRARIVRHAYHYEGVSTPRTLRYEYDPLGREAACIHDDGTRIERRLHFNGWLKAIPGILKNVAYDSRGLPIEIHFENETRTQLEYTPGPGCLIRQVTSSPSGLLEDTRFTLDKIEMMLGSDNTAPGGTGLRQFSYDPLYQLSRMVSVENGAAVQRAFEYVNDFNLSRFEEGRCTIHYDDSQHPERLTGLTSDGGTRFDVDYDGNGNLLSLPNGQFSYNAKNELLRFLRGDGLKAEYRYDHQGLRVSKRVDDGQGNIVATRYAGSVAEFRDVNGGPDESIYHVRLGTRRVAVIRGDLTNFFHEDGLGSTSFVTDASGQVIARVNQLPFGGLASGGVPVDFRTYAMHPVDQESGLVYMRRRYYSPALGRFLTPDLMAIYKPEELIHHPQSLHLYSYVANNPLNRTDPTGLSFWSVVGMIVGVAAGVALGLVIVGLTAGLGVGIVGFLITMGVMLGATIAVIGISYAIAANLDAGSGGQEFLRGFMIGFNAGMNAAMANSLFCTYAAIAIGVIGSLAAFDSVAKRPIYQGILGWSSLVMPMSWTVTAIGLVFCVVNFIACAVTWNGDWWGSGAKIEKLSIDWRTGTVVMAGGLTSPGRSNIVDGYNLGNFVYVNPKTIDNGTYADVMRHETGHTLNTAAFGTAFEAFTFIDQVLFVNHYDAYGEMVAESIVNRGGVRHVIPMWS